MKRPLFFCRCNVFFAGVFTSMLFFSVAFAEEMMIYSDEFPAPPDLAFEEGVMFSGELTPISFPEGSSQEIRVDTIPHPTPSAASVLIRDLSYGMNGEDVRVLQQFLNTRGFLVASSGPGSPGNETNFFGPATREALARFQLANNISPAFGYFGPITRQVIDTSVPRPPINPEGDPARDLTLGIKGSDVRKLQERLMAEDIGSAATALSRVGATGYFGELTRAALAEYQAANGITPAHGYFGPVTRAFMLPLSLDRPTVSSFSDGPSMLPSAPPSL